MTDLIPQKPVVTVLMSVYNGMPHLPAAIDSILGQTLTNFKFIIIDDASTDGTAKILSDRARKDSRIEVITNQRNRGLGYNLARGLAIATTPWVARMDADDLAVPERLEWQIAYVREHPAVDILGGYALDMGDRGQILGERKVPTTHEAICRLVWTNPFIHGTILMRREAILRVGSYRPQLAKRQDYELWFRCVTAGLIFANLSQPLIYYRFSDNTFKRNNWRVALAHVGIGWRGCWQVKAAPFAYLAITKQLVIVLLPPYLRTLVYNWLKQFDPRAKVT